MKKRNVDIALDYAKRGWAVLPVHGLKDGQCTCAKGKECSRPGKHPCTRNGVKDATTDTKTIKVWWKARPSANIAIATGTTSGLLVLDLDPRNGGEATLEDAKKKYGVLPETATALTGGNGKHFIFAHPKKPLRSDTGGKVFGLGLDVLSNGHYFIAPGSMGIQRKYAWAAGKSVRDLKPVPLPAPWRAALSKKARAKMSPAPVKETIPEGSRNNELTSMAGSMRRAGMAQTAIEAALVAQNMKCVPPLPIEEVKSIVASVCTLYPAGAGDTDPALQLVHGVMANHFAGGRNLILEQGRFWLYGGTHWERVSDEWIKNKILCAIEDFSIKTRSNTASLLDQCLRIMQARLAAQGDRLAGLTDDKPIINTLSGELWLGSDGSVDLRTHRPESYLTHCLNIPYDPKATCPMYDRAVEGIFSKADNPKAMIRNWNELVGYIIQPSRHLALIAVGLGGGSNGKTKLVNTIIKLLGEDLVSAQAIGSFDGNRFAIASLFGKLLLLDDDVNSGTRLPDGFLKTTSEGKVVTGEEKYKSPFTFRARTVPFLLCNNPPSCADLTYGFQRRLMVIPFDKKFKGKGNDTTLFNRIWETELPGVLVRALEGLARLRQRGRFMLPKAIKAANKRFLSDGNPVPAFVEECCAEDLTSGIYLAEFYVRYQSWCVESGITMKQQRGKVKQNLENLGYQFGRGNKGPKVMGLRFT